ncbi:UDP-3-O-[3-hydroxymyristoyl] glucosamine N-acyltransferase [Candidatus Blochmanniella vafra str. BVAF]|uniref:UDP-3-O-(3-hydroxymyristoyl)glucosamine N-acyltransferase n=1 Tax=Blochmanniella vafra (strain BVAF) TaxID=859654 RepID=E8Q6T5_BLOVB|nr:UDP-3-O-(3-hydroxymyristoyl)glucosamine N-acyltransferase [Candidatus Blochmannia vafer]ADV33682.1 UDP-3-O-[3-hydroxymyristoyl] glucosamine N-acyltransferase [Candidatus Blochmannia vafer str. BVAF]
MCLNKIRLFELAKKIGAELHGNGNIYITQVSSIKKAQSGHITFLNDLRYKNQLRFCSASAIIVSKENLKFCRSITALVVQDPILTYIKIFNFFHTQSNDKFNSHISAGSVIDKRAVLSKNVKIGNNVIIRSGAVVEDKVKIGSGCFIGKNVKIGEGTCLCSNVVVHSESEIGKYCRIQSGSVIGSDGFGYIKRNNIWIKIPQLGRVNIENYVEIGSCTTIDRGALDDTHIKNGVIIDNQCQIAHNVVIGEHTAIAGGVIIAGSVIIGNHCMIGGASVINGHISICDNAVVTGMSMVIRSISQPRVYSSGLPVQPNFSWKRTTALVMKIREINKRIKKVEKKTHYSYYYRILGIIYFFTILSSTSLILLINFLFNQE